MTFREKLMQEHPECITSEWASGCEGCPSDYGYEPELTCGIMLCKDCWSREMPMTPEEQEANDLRINEEIIRAYCRAYCGEEIECEACPAYHICSRSNESWHIGLTNYPVSAAKQRAMLDAFESALPPLDEDDAERTDTPQNDHCAEHDPINHPSQPMQHDAVNNPSQPTQHDAVNHPSHYTSGKVECIDAIESAIHAMQGERAFLTGQVIKYLWRWPLKNGVEDLRKARWYLDRLIKFVEDVNAERSN